MIFKPLGVAAKIVAGQSPESSTYNSTGQGLPFFQGKADFQAMYPTVRMWCTSLRRKEAEPGDILISIRAPVGAVNICNQKSIIGRGLAAIRPLSDLNGRFLYYYLKANEKQIDALGTGSTFKAITQDTLKKISIPIPPIDDQIRIAHLLGKVEGLIAQRKQHLQQLDELLKSVFLEMFGDPARNEKGWVPTTIGDSVEIQSGQVDPRELPYSEMPHVGGANIESESGNLVELKQAKHENLISGKYLFDSTYILYSKIRPYLNKVSKPHFQGVCSADIYPIKPIAGLLNRDFLRMLLMSKAFLNYTANNSDRANIPKINRKALVAFGFNRPPIDVQNRFAIIVKKIEDIKSRYQQSLTDLEALYGALSQQAFKGELDLSRVVLNTRNMGCTNVAEAEP